MTVRIATLNCRNVADRWPERGPLLVDQMVELAPDVIGLQELRHFPSQAAWIANQVGVRSRTAHWLHTTYKTGVWWFREGIAILTRLPIVERGGLRLDGEYRVANLTRLRLPDGGLLDFYNTHLATEGADVRERQVAQVLAWMESRPGVPQVLVGDFNAAPTARSIERVRQSLRSAYAVAHGQEPPKTVPTPLRQEIQGSSRSAVLDYLFVGPGVGVASAQVTFDRPAAHDPLLYASDHFGLAADISTTAGA